MINGTESEINCTQKKSSNQTVNLMDIDDDLYESNGFTNGHCESNGDDELLIRILQFGKELHALKQDLNHDFGDNPQNDKILQV